MNTPGTGDERAVLEYQLDMQRNAFATMLQDLTEGEARTRLVPSLTTPLALVSHATFVEQVWFHHRVAGMSREEVGIPESVDDSFIVHPQETVDSVRRRYLQACDRSRGIAADHDVAEIFDWHGSPVTLRFIYAHLLTELARHAGHGDILVEQLQARRGIGRPVD